MLLDAGSARRRTGLGWRLWAAIKLLCLAAVLSGLLAGAVGGAALGLWWLAMSAR